MDKVTFKRGNGIRRKVLGEHYVEKALAAADDFNTPLQVLVTEYCWGAVWGRDGLPRKTRSLLNLAMISALNRPHELKAHIRGAPRNAVSRAESAKYFFRWRSIAAFPQPWTRSVSLARFLPRTRRLADRDASRAAWRRPPTSTPKPESEFGEL